MEKELKLECERCGKLTPESELTIVPAAPWERWSGRGDFTRLVCEDCEDPPPPPEDWDEERDHPRMREIH